MTDGEGIVTDGGRPEVGVEEVVRTNSPGNCYHDDWDCHVAPQPEHACVLEVEEVSDERDPCQHCLGDSIDRGGSSDWSYQLAIARASGGESE